MKTAGIIANAEKDPGYTFANEVAEWLRERGCRVRWDPGTPPTPEMLPGTDFIVVLGGDGTILRTAAPASLHGIPLLGVNLGTLGYLTDVEQSEVFAALDSVLRGDYALEQRMMLEGTLGNQQSIALNEICVTKSEASHMIAMEIFVNGGFADSYRADGLIVATPTGSTAYNLSAGGPILKPDADMIAVTPICPHALSSRPWVIAAQDVVEVRLAETGNNNGLIVFDGHNSIPVCPGETVRIRKSEQRTGVIKTNRLGFYDILRRKMMRK